MQGQISIKNYTLQIDEIMTPIYRTVLSFFLMIELQGLLKASILMITKCLFEWFSLENCIENLLTILSYY